MRTSHLPLLGFAILVISAAVAAQVPPNVVLLGDLNPTPQAVSSDPEFGAVLPNGLCVFAARTRAEGLEPWLMGPTGPSLLKDIAVGRKGSAPRGFVRVGSFVYFTANDGIHGSELWKTDGTFAGTILVVDLLPGAPGSLPQELVDVNGNLFFTAFDAIANRELHTSDGTAAGTILVADIMPGIGDPKIGNLVACGNRVLFVADNFTNGDELWVSDGTATGTMRLSDFRPGPPNGVSRVKRPVCCQGRVYFEVISTSQGEELGVSDGTVGGTLLLLDVNPGGSSSSPSGFTCCGNEVFFAATRSGVGRELFKTDGTSVGTVLVKDVNPGSSGSSPSQIVCCDGQVFFAAQDNTIGQELYVSDGTIAGTVLVKDILVGFVSSAPTSMICCDGRVYFSAADATSGRELWSSDGTTAGTTLVVDSAPGTAGSLPQNLFCCGTTVLYSNEIANGRELFRSDGTAIGTVEHDLEPLIGTASSSPAEFTAAGPREFFFAATTPLGRELCYFDGTQVIVHDIESGPSGSFPQGLMFVGDTLFFEARTTAQGRELYKATRTLPPTLVTDLVPGTGGSQPQEIRAFGRDQVIFSTNVPGFGREVGLAGGPINGIRLLDVRPGSSSSSPRDFTVAIDDQTGVPIAFFAANDGVHGVELHATNGTITALVQDANPGNASGDPTMDVLGMTAASTELVVVPVELIFAATVGSDSVAQIVDVIDPFGLLFNRTTLFIVGGFEIQEIRKATSDSGSPGGIGGFVGAVIESISSGTGSELFTFDSNSGFVVQNLLDGIGAGSTPRNFARNGDITHFTATGTQSGNEVFRYDASTGSLTTVDMTPGPESSTIVDIATFADTAFVAVSGTDPRDIDVIRINANSTTTVIVDLDAEPSGEVFNENVLSRYFDEILARGNLVAQGTEPVRITEAGAASHPFGSHGPGSNLSVTDPKLGCDVRVQVGFFGLNITSLIVAVDFDPLISPFPFAAGVVDGELWLDPATLLVLFQNFGSALDVTFALPSDPSLSGLKFVLQGAGFGPNGVFLTNALGATVR